ncbi:hypothetical protein D3C87_161860 [compost metagenome]
MNFFYSILLVCLTSVTAYAQDAQPRVGRDAAAKYFQRRDPAQSNMNYGGSGDHYLAIHFGRYMSSQAYEWGQGGRQDDVGKNFFGVTYRVGEWYNSMDLNIRIDYAEYDVIGEKPTKLSLMPLITFPDAGSRFPLYFGAGAGLGVFFKQVNGESALSFDYQLVAGARFFNVFENTGFFIESGIKNHLQLLNSGQLNGTFLALGAVFTF